jgi:hypothetical protein
MKVKYPRTPHFDWSEGATNDDKIISDLSNFIGQVVIVSEKLDGENSTLMKESTYARSLDSVDHPSRHWLKGLWSNIRHEIPLDWRICGENVFAKHSIQYNNLDSYFYVFSIWNENNVCLSVDETLDWCNLLNLKFVPILYRGVFDIDLIKSIKIDENIQEGYVVRLTKEFHYDDFNKSCAKYVRKNHVQTNEHWMYSKIITNKLKQ